MDWIRPLDFVDPPAPPVDLTRAPAVGVGLPRGFVAAGNGLPCDWSTSAFVRGLLIDNSVYNSMGPDEHLSLQDPNRYPLWRLYGGPLSTRDLAAQWDQFLYFWAFNNNRTWISHNPVCVAPSWAVKWPADTGMRWDWVFEPKMPPYATRYYDGSKNVVQVIS